jgi:hypothetical protein
MLTVIRPVPRGATLLVSPGQAVGPETVVATLELDTLAMRKVQYARVLGHSPQEAARCLLVGPGDPVVVGQALAVRTVLETPVTVSSPTAGRVALVSAGLGNIYVRETVQPGDKPVRMDLSERLGVPRSQCRLWVKVKLGDEVYRGQVIASLTLPVGAKTVTAVLSGTVSEVSAEGSVLTIEPAPCLAGVSALVAGTVSEAVPGHRVSITTAGERVEGVFGVGGPAWGHLTAAAAESHPAGSLSGAVVLLSDSPDAARLRELAGAGAVAVVAPHVDQLELVDYLGYEIRLGITSGTEGSGMALVFLGGFTGSDRDVGGTLDWLLSRAGRPAYVDGRTQVRAGVRRPEIIVAAAAANGAQVRDGARPAPLAVSEDRARVAEPTPAPEPPAGASASVRAPGQPQPAADSRIPDPERDWVYAVARPRTAQDYAKRFRVSALPSWRDLTRRGPEGFPTGLPVVAGAVAERLAGLAAEVAVAALPALEQALAEAPERLGADPEPVVANLLVGGSMLRRLRRAEIDSGWGAKRTARERECPAFVLTGRSPATVLRAIPARGGVALLVPLGRACGWGPWHVDALSRSDALAALESAGAGGVVKEPGSGPAVLRAMGLGRAGLTGPTSLALSVLDLSDVTAGYGWLDAAAGRLAGALAGYWATLDGLLAGLLPPPGGERTEAPGYGDLVEAFYACLADAILVAGQAQGLLSRPLPPPTWEEFVFRTGFAPERTRANGPG